MIRVETIDGIYAVVFERWRGRVPLLERKVGAPMNPEGADLWVLTDDLEDVDRLKRWGTNGINEYVAASRRHTFEKFLPQIPSDAAVTFSRNFKIDDNALLQGFHDLEPRMMVSWNKDSYYLEAETIENGAYSTKKSRISSGDVSPEAFAKHIAAAAKRLAKRAPPPYLDTDDGLLISSPAAELLESLTAVAAQAFAWWIDKVRTSEQPPRKLTLSANSFHDAQDIKALRLEYNEPRIRSEIVYADGSVLSDLGLLVKAHLPETTIHGLAGLPIDKIVAGRFLGPWPVIETTRRTDGNLFRLSVPSTPLNPAPSGHPVADPNQALHALLRRDLFEDPVIAPVLEASQSSRPAHLRATRVAAMTIERLPAEVALHVLGEILSPLTQGGVDLGRWLDGVGTLRINTNCIDVDLGMGSLGLADFLESKEAS